MTQLVELGKRFRSDDGRFGLVLPLPVLSQMQQLCARSQPLETGGILVGSYSENLDVASVTSALPAPADSVSTPTRFVRGTAGLSGFLARVWKGEGRTQEYYLGEWHYHPGQPPEPSEIDLEQMVRIARSPRHECPRPLLVIVGDPSGRGWSLSVRVFTPGGRWSLLHPL